MGLRPGEWHTTRKRATWPREWTKLRTAGVDLGAALRQLEAQDEGHKDRACWRYMGLDIQPHDSQDRLVYTTPENMRRMREFIELECSRPDQWPALALGFDDWSYEPGTLC